MLYLYKNWFYIREHAKNTVLLIQKCLHLLVAAITYNDISYRTNTWAYTSQLCSLYIYTFMGQQRMPISGNSMSRCPRMNISYVHFMLGATSCPDVQAWTYHMYTSCTHFTHFNQWLVLLTVLGHMATHIGEWHAWLVAQWC